MAQKRFHGLKKIKIRATWNKYNLYNLSRSTRPPSYRSRTFYQQKWSAKSDMRAYHGEYIREGQWERMFSPHLNAVVQMDHKYLAEHDGSELAAGRGSGREVPIGSKKYRPGSQRLPYQNMTFAPIERRLDMAIFRALFASSAKQARQLVVHGAVKVNGYKMPYPGYLLNPGDMFQVDIDRVLFATGAIKTEEQAAQGRSLRSKEKNLAKELLQDTSPLELKRREAEKKRVVIREEMMKKGEILEEPEERKYEPVSFLEDSRDTRDEIKFRLERYGLRRIALRLGKAGSGQGWRLTDKEKKERRDHMTKIKIFNGKRHNIPFEEFKETAKKLFIRANALSLNVKSRIVPRETLDLLSLKEGEELAKATVPKRIVEAIAGKPLTDLQERTGCRIRIPFDWEKGLRTGTQTLTLLGTQEATIQAKALIEAFIEKNPEGPPPSVSEKSICLNCSEPGHHWRGCAQPLTATIEAIELRDQKLRNENFKREKASRTCMNCRQPGHVSSDCTQPKTEATIKAHALRDQTLLNAKRADTSRNVKDQTAKPEARALHPTAQTSTTPAEKRALEASGTSKYALKKAAELQEALARQMEKEDENPVNALKAYATPWQPRPYMSPFAFIPRYLEVHHAIASAVYLRHPVVRQGLAEVPTPFSPETNQLAFNWYLRRR